MEGKMILFYFSAVSRFAVIQGNPPPCPCPAVLQPLASVCVFGRFKWHKLPCYFKCMHSGDLHVILSKRPQPVNVYYRGTMARLIELCVPFVSVYMFESPPFPASHGKGLFGFIVQEGLCAQLAH